MQPKKVLISGSSGLIGSALTRSFQSDGVDVSRLVRRQPQSESEVNWDPDRKPLDPQVLEGVDVVINLNGASIGHLPWTSKYRALLRSSRINPTRTLATALREKVGSVPKFVSASAVGFYGARPGEQLDETSAPGTTFLAQLCVAWEKEALSAGERAKVAVFRTAPLLHPQATLKPLIPLTRLGVSGPLGGGRQLWSWISLDDEVRAIRYIINHDIEGPVNLSGPAPASANQIGQELARQLRRPYFLPVPAWALRLVIGRDAADSLLAEVVALPTVLRETGFGYSHPTVEDAIHDALATKD
ncbi:TIGR01777 family oxidoreductase [Corynebacterium lubricantis]|uniref:TIGR01777 family oxidoreductase n=1 Tax=Corynebacterium lubricantis TaxID=541095 RepID=UPI00036ECE54|nr:TIGR01777 family oxidoreductase [Corynebacterium lubricantis]